MEVEIKNSTTKCYNCMRPSNTCICQYLNPVDTQTRFIILMHPKEYKKEKNGTGHMTKLQLSNSEIIVGVDFTDNKRVNEILNQESISSFLLYPGKESLNLSTSKGSEINAVMGKNLTIFILDGTWPCARKMLKLSTNLQQLKRVSFDNKIQSKFIFKQQPEPLCLSTIESVYTVLKLLNQGGLENSNTTNFLLPFEKMVAYQLKYLLNTPHKNNSVSANKEILAKTTYRKSQERNIIFE